MLFKCDYFSCIHNVAPWDLVWLWHMYDIRVDTGSASSGGAWSLSD